MDTYETEFVDISENNVDKIEIKNEPIEDNDLGNQKCGDIFLFDGRHFTFSCYFCSMLFTEYEMFTNHILEEHSKVFFHDETEQELKFETIVEETPIEDVTDDNSMESCENLPERETTDVPNTQSPSESQTSWLQCDQNFRTELGLTRHRKNQNHEITTNRSGGIEVPIENYKTTKKHSKRYKCKFCEFSTNKSRDLRKHESIHTGGLPHQCETCKKRFRKKCHLNRHLIIHTNSRPYSCSYCQSAFKDSTNLKVHIRRKHLEEKRFKCDYCEKTFVTTTERTAHMRLHTHEKPYQCEECGRGFRVQGQLTLHKRLRHSEEKNFSCKECGKTFKANELLKCHMIMHSNAKPFKCKTCGAAFPRRNALAYHMKLHLGFKEYSCKICDKEFTQNAGLTSHMKSHKIDTESRL